MKKRYLLVLPAVALIVACEPEIKDNIDSNTYYAGDADFSSYVAVGNSLTAGYMDGTVFRTGQQNSFPNILANQFKVVGGGEFTQPSYDDDVNDVGGLLLGGTQIAPAKMILNMSTGGPEVINKTVTIDITKQQQKAYHNAGVPGAKSFHLLAPGYGDLAGVARGTANPYFVRTATSASTTVLADALSLKPTFFSNWIGSNDVLAYATSGGDAVDPKNGQDQNVAGGLDPNNYSPNDITNINVFDQVYNLITDQLVANGAKGGIVATIPYVTAIPFFTTVPYNPISPQMLGENLDQLNVFVGMLKTILSQAGQGDRIELFSKTAANPLLIQDRTLEDMTPVLKLGLSQVGPSMGMTQDQIDFIASTYGQARHATAKDLMLLTSKGLIGAEADQKTGNAIVDAMLITGITYPIKDEFVLNPIEQEKIKSATDSFNATIRGAAVKHGLAIADMNELLNRAVSGIRVEDGQIYTADYFQGLGNLNTVMFSLDGVHLNGRGYAFISSEILKVINKHFKANIPLVNPATFPGPTLLASNPK